MALLREAGDAQRLREPAVRGPAHARDARGRGREPGLERAHPRRPAALPRRGGPRSRRRPGCSRRASRAACRGPAASARVVTANGRLIPRSGRSATSWCSTASARPTTRGGPCPAAAIAARDDERRGSSALPRSIATPRPRGPSAAGLARGSGLVVRVTPARRLVGARARAWTSRPRRSPCPGSRRSAGRSWRQGPARAGLPVGERRAARRQAGAARVGRSATGAADEVRLVFQGPGPRLARQRGLRLRPGRGARARPDGARAAAQRYDAARAGRWDEARAPLRRGPPARARSRLATTRPGPARAGAPQGRRWLDVESLDDGGPELVELR